MSEQLLFKASLELWLTLVEICFFKKPPRTSPDARRHSAPSVTGFVTMPRHPHTLADIRPVDLFVAYLYDLPLPDWVQATRTSLRGAASEHAASSLASALQRFMDPRAIFETRAAVLSALQRFDTADGRRLTRSRDARRTLRPATEQAALAVLARRHLDAGDFDTLYAPFESRIPAVFLFGLPA
jgi:hypothetical protein